MISDYEEGGLKDIDIKAKIASFHLCWLKRLYADNFHPWKNIPLKLIEKQYEIQIFSQMLNLNLTIIFQNATIPSPKIGQK